MGSRFNGYGFVLGLVMGVVIGIFTGSIALWIAVGVVLGVAFSRGRKRREVKTTEVEILPPLNTKMRTR